jgi:hypothetical protein
MSGQSSAGYPIIETDLHVGMIFDRLSKLFSTDVEALFDDDQQPAIEP